MKKMFILTILCATAYSMNNEKSSEKDRFEIVDETEGTCEQELDASFGSPVCLKKTGSFPGGVPANQNNNSENFNGSRNGYRNGFINATHALFDLQCKLDFTFAKLTPEQLQEIKMQFYQKAGKYAQQLRSNAIKTKEFRKYSEKLICFLHTEAEKVTSNKLSKNLCQKLTDCLCPWFTKNKIN